jgi:hypothetical protein
MSEEYDPLTVEFETIGTKKDIAEWIERLNKVVALTQTPKVQLEVKFKELKPSKDWQPKKRTPTIEELSNAKKETEEKQK